MPFSHINLSMVRSFQQTFRVGRRQSFSSSTLCFFPFNIFLFLKFLSFRSQIFISPLQTFCLFLIIFYISFQIYTWEISLTSLFNLIIVILETIFLISKSSFLFPDCFFFITPSSCFATVTYFSQFSLRFLKVFVHLFNPFFPP